jgi:DNA-binding transcriptional regulator LsrR (DeoR family)
MVADGTSCRGEQHGNAKLTEADVHEIRRLHSEDGLGHRRIARRFDVSRAAVHRILTGRAWAHLKEAEASVA